MTFMLPPTFSLTFDWRIFQPNFRFNPLREAWHIALQTNHLYLAKVLLGAPRASGGPDRERIES
ncbi:MAG: hypothetical protein U5K56_21240 [Halioglobus sp.]|nr:hypothetical protein [Halioglobus sp.]